ncbi:MAG: LPS export ABC transporter ATP-binding protein [Spirochaetaceae bacterium]|nr:MAG: LPS export ABC transporter ATP-binding protein [Spirochaetaceae bacterium]
MRSSSSATCARPFGRPSARSDRVSDDVQAGATFSADAGTDARVRLTAANLTKSYGRKMVVRGVSFEMHEGEIVGFLGPNGAGKTTCFYMIVGFIRPNSGRIYLSGREITRRPMYQRARAGISYLPQEPSVFRKLTVEQNIKAVLETRRDLTRAQKRQTLEELLQELGIEHKRKQRAYTLSGGERRRTEIARSLAIRPRFLLLDEPFAGIDPIAVYEIKQIVAKLSAKGIGVLITDHNVRDTLEITHRSYIIKDGEIVVAGSREEVMQNEIARKVYLGDTFTI